MVKKMNKFWAFFYKDSLWIPGVNHRMSLAECCFTAAVIVGIGYFVAKALGGA